MGKKVVEEVVQTGVIVEDKGMGYPRPLLLVQRQPSYVARGGSVAGGGRWSQIMKVLQGHAIAFRCCPWGPEGF